MSKKDLPIKLLILGDENSGKTSFILRYLKGEFVWTTDFHLKGVNWFHKNSKGENSFAIDMWDVAGKDRFRNFIPYLTNFIDGVILTFDSSSSDSQKNLETWIKLLEEKIPSSIPRLLISLKNDLDTQINMIHLSHFILRHNISDYLPVSAVTGLNIDRIFDLIVKNIIEGN